MVEGNNPMFGQAHMSSSHAMEASMRKENHVNPAENVLRMTPIQHIDSAFTMDVAPLKVIDVDFDAPVRRVFMAMFFVRGLPSPSFEIRPEYGLQPEMHR